MGRLTATLLGGRDEARERGEEATSTPRSNVESVRTTDAARGRRPRPARSTGSSPASVKARGPGSALDVDADLTRVRLAAGRKVNANVDARAA